MTNLIEVEHNLGSARKLLSRIQEQFAQLPDWNSVGFEEYKLTMLSLSEHILKCVTEMEKSTNIRRESRI